MCHFKNHSAKSGISIKWRVRQGVFFELSAAQRGPEAQKIYLAGETAT